MKRGDIKIFKDHDYEISIGGLKRSCPLYEIKEDIWIVGNDHISFGTDIEFTHQVGKLMSENLRKFRSDIILTAEARALGIAYEVSKNLSHECFAIARKSIKSYNKNTISSKIASMTSSKVEYLYLDKINIDRIKGKDVILFDDVISTGSTMNGLREIANKSDANIIAMAAVWIEGPWLFERFEKELDDDKLIYLDILPIFARGSAYEELYKKNSELDRK